MRFTPVLLVSAACTINGKPFTPFGGGGGTSPATATAPAADGAGGAVAQAAEPKRAQAKCPDGKRYFLGAPEILPGHGVQAVALADINGDGKVDIVTGNPHGKRPPKPHLGNIGVMLGKGGGQFAEMEMTPVGTDNIMAFTGKVSLGDLDGDKRPDVVFNGPGWIGSTPAYALSNGDGTFAEQVSLRGSDRLGTMLIADVNGDKRNDVIISNMMWLNSGGTKGDVKFSGKVQIADWEFSAEAIADLDGDGAPDIVMRPSDGQKIVPFMNDGNGSFTKGTAIEAQVKSLAVGDFNGDGKPDLAFTNEGSVGIALGKGGGAFGTPKYVALPESFGAFSITATDLNSDGKADAIVLGEAIAVYMNDGGALSAPIKLPAAGAFALAAADLTGDKVQSIVAVDDSESSDEAKSHIYLARASCR